MKKLLSSNNLDPAINDGIGLAGVCRQALQSEIFIDYLKNNLEKKSLLSTISLNGLVQEMAEKIQKELVVNCSSQTIINSLQQGIEKVIAGDQPFRTDWIVGNKIMKKTIRDITEAVIETHAPNLDKGKTVAEIKLIVLTAFQLGLAETAPILRHKEFISFVARNYLHMGMIPYMKGRIRLLKEQYRYKEVVTSLHHAVSIINCIPDPHVLETGTASKKNVGNRFKNSLLKFSLTKLQQNTEVRIICTVCDFFRLLLEKNVVLYFHPEYDNDFVLIEAVFNAIVRGSVKIQVLTCPDYSGYIKNGLWNFDFRTLNDGEGIVAQKSYGVTEALYHTCKECSINVTVDHYLPFFEFKDGFRGDEYLTPDGVREKLKRSLECIGHRYIELSIPVRTRSTEEIILNEAFFSQAEKAEQEVILKMLNDDEPFQKFFIETFRKRFGIYSAWFPQGDMLDDQYETFLKKKLITQLAEYYVDSNLFHDGGSIMVFSDSAQMSYAYNFWKIPAICGHGKTSMQYIG